MTITPAGDARRPARSGFRPSHALPSATAAPHAEVAERVADPLDTGCRVYGHCLTALARVVLRLEKAFEGGGERDAFPSRLRVLSHE